MKKNQNKNIAIFAFSLLALIGTYNAVMINSESDLAGAGNFKRLDEVFGVVKAGRTLAVESSWKKISKTKPLAAVTVAASQTSSNTASFEEAPVGAIQDSLDLKLVEVNNPKKWANGVKAEQFSGAIAANNGIIESLTASLPEGMSIEIAFSEMTGNTFEYDLNGEVYTGMMYQVDQSAYMITMTNGPLEGTRMRFAGETKDAEAQKEQTKEFLAETHNVEVQEFGAENDIAAAQVEASEPVATETAEAASFNFNI